MSERELPGGVQAITGQEKAKFVSIDSNTNIKKNNLKFDQKTIIYALKKMLPSIPSLCPGIRKETAKSLCGPCPKCGGDDRFVYKIDKDTAFCRICHEKRMDRIDFHCWLYEKRISDLIKEYLPDIYTQQKESNQQHSNLKHLQKEWNNIVLNYTNKKPVFDLLCDKRKLSKTVVKKLFDQGLIRFKNHGQKKSVVVPFQTIQGQILAWQYLSVDGKPYPFTTQNGKPANKVFIKGSLPGKDCFFIAGVNIIHAKMLIICESVINAITAHECFPDACCIALGGSTYISKVKILKPYLEYIPKIIVCVDNDDSSEKMLRGIWDIIGTKVSSFKWENGLPKGFDINDALQDGKKKLIIDLIKNADTVFYKHKTITKSLPSENETWDFVKNRFPKGPFPWDVLPNQLSFSLKQLGRSCATSPTHLPGIACAVLAAVLGRHIEVEVKPSWEEPLIFWMLTLLPSGEGKTPAQNLLNGPIYTEQIRLDNIYKKELEQWEALPTKEQKQTPKPNPPGGIFISDMIIEALRIDQRSCGGVLNVNDEASSFFDGQNQYKSGGKGTDRQAYLKLYDGKPARIVRTSGATFLKGTRVSIAGGTQPEVFMRIFKPNDEGAIFLVDGTIFRFMMTWEGEKFFPMVLEPWDENNHNLWSGVIENAIEFCDKQTRASKDGEDFIPHKLYLSNTALEFFIEWANDIRSIKPQFPEQVRGFVSKLIGWAIRLTGIIRCFDSFIQGNKVNTILETKDLQKGIELAEFYMAHNIDIVQAILSQSASINNVFTAQEIHLARTLQSEKINIDSGRLAIGYIWQKYNQSSSSEVQYKNARAMGSFIRSCNLTIQGGKHDANGKRAVKCLEWDKKTDCFIKACLQEKQCLQENDNNGFQDQDIISLTDTMSTDIPDEAII